MEHYSGRESEHLEKFADTQNISEEESHIIEKNEFENFEDREINNNRQENGTYTVGYRPGGEVYGDKNGKINRQINDQNKQILFGQTETYHNEIYTHNAYGNQYKSEYEDQYELIEGGKTERAWERNKEIENKEYDNREENKENKKRNEYTSDNDNISNLSNSRENFTEELLLKNKKGEKKKKKYEMVIGKKNDKPNQKGNELPYSTFNDLEKENYAMEIEQLNENTYNLFNKEKLSRYEKNKKVHNEKKKREKETADIWNDKKFSEVYNSIYENLGKKKKTNKQNSNDNELASNVNKNKNKKKSISDPYLNKLEFYEINYSSSDNVNYNSANEEDSIFSERVLKAYVGGQILNILRTSFHWSVTSFFLVFLFYHFSIFYVYRLIYFLSLLLFTPISIYIIKEKNIKYLLLGTNIIRLFIWGIFIPLLYFLYRGDVKKHHINLTYEIIFFILLLVDNLQINVSNIIDLDNNGLDFLSRKYDLSITEKSKRKFLNLHQFFFDVSFIIMNPIFIFIIYLISTAFDENMQTDFFINASSCLFSIITIITLLIYGIGLKHEKTEQETSHPIDDVEQSTEQGETRAHDTPRNYENEFEKYYTKHKDVAAIQDHHFINNNFMLNETMRDINRKVILGEQYVHGVECDSYIDINENISLKDQYKKQFSDLYNNFCKIKKKKKNIFYICMLTYLNSVEDTMVLMFIPLTSVYVSEFFYVHNVLIQVLISVTLVSLTKCFENISAYSNRKNIITVKDIFIGILLTGCSLLLYFFPVLMLNHLSIWSFLSFYVICCLFYFFFATNLKSTLSSSLQRSIRNLESDVYNLVGFFMAFVNLIFIFITSFIFSIFHTFIINFIIMHSIFTLFFILFYIWGAILHKENRRTN